MSEPNVPETGTLLDLETPTTEDVSSTTPPIGEPRKEDEVPSPTDENLPDEKEETPAVEDLPTEKKDSDEKPEETASTKG